LQRKHDSGAQNRESRETSLRKKVGQEAHGHCQGKRSVKEDRLVSLGSQGLGGGCRFKKDTQKTRAAKAKGIYRKNSLTESSPFSLHKRGGKNTVGQIEGRCEGKPGGRNKGSPSEFRESLGSGRARGRECWRKKKKKGRPSHHKKATAPSAGRALMVHRISMSSKARKKVRKAAGTENNLPVQRTIRWDKNRNRCRGTHERKGKRVWLRQQKEEKKGN